MKQAFSFFLLFVMAISLDAQRYAIRNVTVIPMDKEQVLVKQTVLIEKNRITRIGNTNSVTIGPDDITIDGTGKYLIPGLFDMHAHFFYEQGENRNTCEKELKTMLANGLTTVRIECGDPVYLEARQNVSLGKWAGPDLFVTSPQFVGRWPWPGKVFAAVTTTPAEAEAAVKKFKKEGYDEIKITFMITRDVYDAIITTAKSEGIKVTGHVGPLVKLPAALAAGQQIEHMDEFIDMLLPDTTYNHGQSVSDMNLWRKNAWATVPYLDESKIPSLVRQVKKAGIYVTPTNFFFFSSFGNGMTDDQYRSRPDYAYIPADILKERWNIRERYWNNAPPVESRKKYVRLREKITYELWRAGVPLMAGSDSPEWFLVQGFALHDELETFVKCGLLPFDALRTATVNTAKYMGLENIKGTITEGKQADLLLLDKNPLDDIRNTRSIMGLFKGGQWFDRKALDKLLMESKPTD